MTSGDLGFEATSDLYRSGIEAVTAAASSLDSTTWHAPACGAWSAAQTANHLLAVAGWYHSWLDRALEGVAGSPFDPGDMDAQNAAALEQMGPLGGPEAIREFSESAHAYLDRVSNSWDIAYGYPGGTVTAGLHCGIAATEWHLHAWDLWQVNEVPYRPKDPVALFRAAGACQAATHGPIRGFAFRQLVALTATRNPWESLLRHSGRQVA